MDSEHIRVEVLREVKTKYDGFEAESEILVKAAKKGFTIGFVDIPTIYGNEKSKMRPVKAIMGFLKVILFKFKYLILTLNKKVLSVFLHAE